MQNIDPVLLLEPVIFIALGMGTVVYWRKKRRLAGAVLLLSLLAYASAIILKDVIQAYTANGWTADFGFVSWQTGIYYGLQTSFFEVGMAYLVARYSVGRKLMGAGDAEGYGVSLSFWENTVLLGALSLINLATTYLLIGQGLLPKPVYESIVSSNPSLFYPPQRLVFPIALATLERISSFLAHFAWGYLCVFSVFFRRPVYLALALPMGLIDALVPLAQAIPAWEFEIVVFLLSSLFVAIAWRATGRDRAGSASINV